MLDEVLIVAVVNLSVDWQSMCLVLGELHKQGQLSTEHVKVLNT